MRRKEAMVRLHPESLRMPEGEAPPVAPQMRPAPRIGDFRRVARRPQDIQQRAAVAAVDEEIEIVVAAQARIGPGLRGQRGAFQQRGLLQDRREPGEQPADTVVREIKEETGIDAIVTDLVAVTSSNKVLTYANGDNTMYMDHSFLCALKPGGNAEPFVGDEESLSVGWFDLDDLPTPLAASTSERLELFHTYIENKKHGDAHALFQFDGQQY